MDGFLSRVGFHAVYEKGVQEAIDLAVEHGFSSVQIETAMPVFFPEKYSEKARNVIRLYAEESNVTLKVHAPSEDFSLQTLHSPIQKAIIERQKEVIDFAEDIGAKLVTIHPGTVPVFTVPEKGHVPIDVQYPQLHTQNLRTALMELSDHTSNTLLCIENSPFTAIVMDIIAEILASNRLFLCWDLAKMYHGDGTINKTVENFFLEHLDSVRECHLHDRTSRHGHQIIGEGVVDFRHYIELLSSYDVEYTIEVRPIANAVRSLKALKNLDSQKAGERLLSGNDDEY